MHGGWFSLVEFSYVSKAAADLPGAVFRRLACQTWSHNTRMGLTGVLRFGGGRFEQVIEGPPDIVLPLAARILTDPRHGAIGIRGFRPVAARRFPSWTLEGFDMVQVESTTHAGADNLCFLPLAAPDRVARRAVDPGAALGGR